MEHAGLFSRRALVSVSSLHFTTEDFHSPPDFCADSARIYLGLPQFFIVPVLSPGFSPKSLSSVSIHCFVAGLESESRPRLDLRWRCLVLDSPAAIPRGIFPLKCRSVFDFVSSRSLGPSAASVPVSASISSSHHSDFGTTDPTPRVSIRCHRVSISRSRAQGPGHFSHSLFWFVLVLMLDPVVHLSACV
jgi:hypothetical protein